MSHLHQRVSALVDGELRGRARDRALAHARNCRPCQDEIAATLALKQRLLRLPAAELAADLLGALEVTAPVGRPHGGSSSRVRAVPRRLLLAGGSLPLAVLAVAYAVGAPSEPTSPLVSPPIEDYIAQFARDPSRTALTDPAANVSVGPAQFGADEIEYPLLRAAPTANSLLSGWNPTLPPPFTAPSAADDPVAVALLESATSAPATFAYRGTRRISFLAADGFSTAHVVVDHVPGQGTEFAAAETGSSDVAFVETGGAETDRLNADSLEQLLRTFDVSVWRSATQLGRPATVIEARRYGQLAARFWVDDASGLLLRRDLYDSGRLVRSSRFSSLQLTSGVTPSRARPPVDRSPATALSIRVSPVLQDEGWTCPDRLPGGGSLVSVRGLEGAGEGVEATYTDGLATTSVFQHEGRLDPDSADLAGQNFVRTQLGGSTVFVRYGFPTVAVWQSEAVTYTVVTDAVPSAVGDVVSALPHEPVLDEQTGNRLSTGFSRLWDLLVRTD